MFCSQCGTKMGDDSKFCPNCGAKVLGVPAPAAEPAPAAPVAEPVVEAAPAVEAAPETPVAEAAVPVAAPVAEPVVQSVYQPEVVAVKEPIAEPAAQEMAAPAAEAVAEPVAEAVAEPVAEPVVEAVAEPVVEAVAEPVAEPVIEAVAEPVVEAVAEPVVEPVAEPVVEPAVESVVEPIVEPVAAPVEQATEVLYNTEPAPAAEPQFNAEPQPEVIPAAAPEMQGTPAPEATTTSGPAPAPAKAKKKPKVWLIILIVLAGLFLLCGCGGIITAIVVSLKIKSANQNLNNFVNQLNNSSEVTTEVTGPGNSGLTVANAPDHNLTIEEVNRKVYSGSSEITEVTGADAMIDYLEQVSGNSLSEDQKEKFRRPDISGMPYTEISIYDDEYSNCGWQITFPYACGIDAEAHYISDWDLLTHAEIDMYDSDVFDSVGIHLNNNTFNIKGQVPDEGDYAPNFFEEFADYMRNGQFGIQFVGTMVNADIPGEYGIEGYYQIMFWYDTMPEPYVITYKYDVDYSYSQDETDEYYDDSFGEDFFDEDEFGEDFFDGDLNY